MFRMSDVPDFKKMNRNRKNRRNKARRRERAKNWKEYNLTSEKELVPKTTPEKFTEARKENMNVSDVLKTVSANRKKVRK